MSKILSTLLSVLLITGVFAQTQNIKGVTITGIKGIKKSLADVLAKERAIPANYKVRLRPELEGPRPKGQHPDARPVSKFGTLVTANNVNYRTTSTSPPTQAVNSNFLAIWGSYAAVAGRESPYTPPDNNGDVGTTQIVAVANCRMKVFNKPAAGAALTTPTGSSTTTLTSVLNVDLNTFFSNASLGISSISDPHVRFDRLSGRWFVVAIEVNHKTNNYCCIAVSNGPTITATSNFSFYYFSVTQTGGTSTDFFDYPTLGIDKNYLYIGGNMFANQVSFSGCNMWVVNKANLISATPSLTVTGFPHNIAASDIYTPQGVHNDDPGATQGYFVGASQTFYSKLNIKRVNYGTTPTLSTDIALTTITMASPKTVPTLGGTAIDGNDRRICAAMIKKNKITGFANLWIAQGTRLNSAGIGSSTGDRDGALWIEIGNLTTTPVILQSANLYDEVNPTSSAIYYTYPTIALSGQGHNIMGFTSAGPTRYAQAGAAGRYRTDPAGNFQAPIDLTTSSSSYNPGANRWGDYTQTVVDPSDDMTMWTFTEYAATTNSWGVRAAEFKAPPPATPVLASIPACGSTTTVTINGTSINMSEFFDPGPGYDKHINVSVSGASTIGVSNIVFVNPTQITAQFNVPADAVSGTYTLTVTNPDGQTSTTTFSLICVPATCGDPTGLASSNITNTSAKVDWSFSGTALSYDVQYKVNGSADAWTNLNVTNPTATLNNLSPGITYAWQVKANCTAAS
ncbi:MAG TPA: fibronectin type III domain-containing protein, partial [Chitinophagaceae bacterium]|nr:fibronectin type III domain-containing protein [Chitinophagaceae bacterium]